MTARARELRRQIFAAFAATGHPPALADEPALRELAESHVVVLVEDGDGVRVHMAHPFAGHAEGARVEAGGRTWWGNCAWDGLGIVAALGLGAATIHGNGRSLAVRDGAAAGADVFHIAVPARRWWDDIGFT